MKITKLMVGTLFAMSLTATSAYAIDTNLIPRPAQLTEGQGVFAFSSRTAVVAGDAASQQVAQFFADKVNAATTFGLKVTASAPAKDAITFAINPDLVPAFETNGIDEAYTLTVTPEGVAIVGKTADGLFRGMQSLLQLLPAQVEQPGGALGVGAWNIPVLDINDAPRFSYRGVMLDPCRHWLSAEEVKRQIDMLATYKINRIHWHLTEDQGWRIEIKKYPELNRIGSWRTEDNGTVYGGYYTQDEIRDVVAYAAERHIEIIPELEMPGHELAAIAAFPNLSCRGEAITPRVVWGVEDVVMCPGKEDMFLFLQDIIDEMVPLFPSKYFHIGGDESPRKEWKECPACQKRMKKLKMKDEAQLQDYIIERMAKYLKTKGKSIIGWDEILEGGNLDPSAIVMSWRGEKGGIEAAHKNHYVLMTPSDQGLYFDYHQGESINEPICFGGNYPLERLYNYDPVPAELKKENKGNYVLGVQANCWSEYIQSASGLEYRLYPRALALAEVGWSRYESRDFADFQRRVDGDATLRLKAHGLNFHVPAPEQVGTQCNHIAFLNSYTLDLKTTRPERIVYTTDTEDPTAFSATYTGPLTFTKSAIVKTRCILPCGEMGPVRTFYINKEAYRPAIGTKCHKAEGCKEMAAGCKQKEEVQGVRLRVAYGTYPYNGSGIKACAWGADSIVTRFESAAAVEKIPSNVRGVKNYAATAEAFVEFAEDAVYEFFTTNTLVWIDGELVVDNRSLNVPRNSREAAQIPLKAGKHHVKTLFVGGIFEGWPIYWSGSGIRYRKVGETKYQNIAPEQCTTLPLSCQKACGKQGECKMQGECKHQH